MEGNVLFNNARNILLTDMDHLEIKRGNPLLALHGLLFFISSKGFIICTMLQTGLNISWPLLHYWWGALAGTINSSMDLP